MSYICAFCGKPKANHWIPANDITPYDRVLTPARHLLLLALLALRLAGVCSQSFTPDVASMQAYIKSPNNAGSVYLGYIVSIDGDTLAVAAMGDAGCSTSVVNGASGCTAPLVETRRPHQLSPLSLLLSGVLEPWRRR